MTTILKRTTAIALLAALPLAPIAAHAQSGTDQSATDQSGGGQAQVQSDTGPATTGGQEGAGETAAETAPEPAGTAAPAAAGQAESGEPAGADAPMTTESAGPGPADEQQAGTAPMADDALVARVGDTDIMRSDVLGAIAVLPPELQQQPAEMLVPLALEQLVLRELILQKARAAGLADDPDVAALLTDAAGATDGATAGVTDEVTDGATTAGATEETRENAMVLVWLDRELAGAVTDAAVQETYGTIESEFGDRAPPLETIRPQIEQELRRLAFLELSEALHADADVTLFGPDGQPLAE